ncbi:MAG: class I SAM-dependent methyltransferase [Acidobacteriia bacterium]|nr:class I SAM-dependent methyltransferase [Terriglobia bacterium]
MTPQRTIVGPIYEIAHSVLAECAEFQQFQAGGIARAEFAGFLDAMAPALMAAGLPAEDVHFAKRYPVSEGAFVADRLGELARRGLLPSAGYDTVRYDELAAEMRAHHYHGRFRTYIYPEEARLLFAIADVVRPRSAIFLGSYYGYWAHAALTAIAADGGHAVLVDPDPRAQEVARYNLERSGLAHAVELATTTGEEYLGASPRSFDFVVLDAEGPRTHPDPEQRGKAIYGRLFRHVLPHMPPGAYLVCHNILFQDIAECPYFDGIIARNRGELGPFLDLVGRELRDFVECTSTEGVGIGVRAG